MLTQQSFFLSIIGLFMLSSRFVFGCYFTVDIGNEDFSHTGQFGDQLDNVSSPCIVRFSTTNPGALRLDFNNKIFTHNKNRKRSCLSEYVMVESGDRSVLLCHSNVTVPVQIGDKEDTGYFDMMTPVMVTLHWSGDLDAHTQFLGMYKFVGLTDIADREQTEEDKRSGHIVSKLKLFLRQKGLTFEQETLNSYQFMSRESCYERDAMVCEQSQFCGDRVLDSQCNSSLYLCVARSLQCNGHEDCLPGDISDELGCYLPYAMFSTGGVVLGLTAVLSSLCVYQHHHMMSTQGMTRYKQDLVRRKDKVKARNAENKKNKPESSSSSIDAREMSSLTPMTTSSSKTPVINKNLVPDRSAPPSITPLSASNVAASQHQLKKSDIKPGSNNGTSAAAAVVSGSSNQDNCVPTAANCSSATATTAFTTATLPSSSSNGHRVRQSVSTQHMQTDTTQVTRTISSDQLLGTRDSSDQEAATCLGTSHSVDSVATRESRIDSVHSLKSSNGDICKGGYGYRFDFRSSCEFEFTEDVYI